MTTLRAAATLALEALHEYVPREDYENKPVGNVIDALRTALSEPEQQDTDCHLQGICHRSGYSIGCKPDEHDLTTVYMAGRMDEQKVQRTEQEPVAWMVYTLDGKSVFVTDNPADFTDQHKALPLYTRAEPTGKQVAWYYERDTERAISFAPDYDSRKPWQPLYTHHVDDTALLRQCLDALVAGDWYIDQLEMIVYSADDTGINGERAKVQAAITALRERLEGKA